MGYALRIDLYVVQFPKGGVANGLYREYALVGRVYEGGGDDFNHSHFETWGAQSSSVSVRWTQDV